jgi:uncharacterized cupin superfamily protein
VKIPTAMANLHDPDYDEPRETIPGFTAHRARVGRQLAEEGEEGAHQLVNDTEDEARFLVVSTHGTPDVVLYPDEGKIGPAERRTEDDGIKMYFKIEDAVAYDHGITRPEVGDVDPA